MNNNVYLYLQYINIIDTSGKNIIQFIDTINIVETKISNDALQVTLSNNSKITINEANTFQFELRGNVTSGEKGIIYSFDQLTNLFTQKKYNRGHNFTKKQLSYQSG